MEFAAVTKLSTGSDSYMSLLLSGGHRLSLSRAHSSFAHGREQPSLRLLFPAQPLGRTACLGAHPNRAC